jgi:hypothetical protein
MMMCTQTQEATMMTLTDKDIAKLMEQAPDHIKQARPCGGHRPTVLELKMGKARADEWLRDRAEGGNDDDQ